MAWSTIYDSNTGSDFAGTNAAVGAGLVLVNGWKDDHGNIWSTAAGTLKCNCNAGGDPWYTDYLRRPTGETGFDSRIVIDIPGTALSNGVNAQGLIRWNGNTGAGGQDYRVYVSTNNLYIFKDTTGPSAGTQLAHSTPTTNTAHNFTVDFSITGTALTAILTDVTSSTVLSTLTVSDSAYTSGQYALLIYNGSTGAKDFATRVQTFNVPVGAMTISPTAGAVNTVVTVIATGAGTNWVNGVTTFAVAGGTGASVVTNSINNGAQTANLSLTCGSAVGTLTLSNSLDSATSSFYVVAAHTAVTDSNLFFSPGNWYSDGSGGIQANNVLPSSNFALTTNCGAYMKIAATSTGAGTISVQLDTSMLNTITAANCPRIAISVDGGAFTVVLLAVSATPVTQSLATGLAAGVHTVQINFQGVVLSSSSAMGDRWNNLTTGASVVKVLGVVLDGGSTIAAATVKAKRSLHFGDSQTEAANAVGASNGAGDQDATLGFNSLIGSAFNTEFGIIGNSGQGYQQASYGNVPNISGSYNLYAAGFSRTFIAYDYVTICLGHNGSTTSGNVQTMLTNLRASCPLAKIFQIQTFLQDAASTITAGFNAYQAATPDGNCYLIDPAVNYLSGLYSLDNLHPSGLRGHPTYGSRVIELMQLAMTGAGGGGSFGYS